MSKQRVRDQIRAQMSRTGANYTSARRAVLAGGASGGDVATFERMGWQESPDGAHWYIHHRGAITSLGYTDVDVTLASSSGRYCLADPTRDQAVLRSAWMDASATMLDRLPLRVAAPMLGQVYRAVLGSNPWVLALVGPSGSYKTSVASKAMHHFGAGWDAMSPSSAFTPTAMQQSLLNAQDCLHWVDCATTAVSKPVDHMVRLIHGQGKRLKLGKRGHVEETPAPRISGLVTCERGALSPSAARRALVVPLAREDIDTAQLFPLDEAHSRQQRAVLMSSYISWLADGLTAKSAHYVSIADEYADAWVEGSGETSPQAVILSQGWSGWVAITDFLFAAGAITSAERNHVLSRVGDGLHEAALKTTVMGGETAS